MKLGTQTGSLVNHLQSRAVIGQPEPVVGMGVTFLSWTDRNPGTIQTVSVIGGKVVIEVTMDDAKLVGGSCQSESQEWEFTERPNGNRKMFRREDDGTWEQVGYKEIEGRWDEEQDCYVVTKRSKRLSKIGGCGLRIGQRDKYSDPSF